MILKIEVQVTFSFSQEQVKSGGHLLSVHVLFIIISCARRWAKTERRRHSQVEQDWPSSKECSGRHEVMDEGVSLRRPGGAHSLASLDSSKTMQQPQQDRTAWTWCWEPEGAHQSSLAGWLSTLALPPPISFPCIAWGLACVVRMESILFAWHLSVWTLCQRSVPLINLDKAVEATSFASYHPLTFHSKQEEYMSVMFPSIFIYADTLLAFDWFHHWCAITKYHKLGGSKQQTFMSHSW